MKVVILAGGRGTRMGEVTSAIPKPMVEVAGKPLLLYIMESYAAYGFKDFIIAVGYKGEIIKEYFANLQVILSDYRINLLTGKTTILKDRKPDWNITIVDIGNNTGTGGSIKKLAEYIDGNEFMLTYGDGVADVNIDELLKFHRAHGKLATITAVKMPRFGIVTVEREGRVSSFQEKRLENSPLINGGFMVLSKKVVDYIEGPETVFETTPMQKLCEDGELYAYIHNGFWRAVDTLRDRADLEEVLNDKNSKVKL